MTSAMLPYETPEVGIRWAHKATSFDDAKSNLPSRPDSAVNDARKVMDVELAIPAEKLKLKMPYLRGEKNDHRTCFDFLKRLTSDGAKCLQRKHGAGFVPHTDAIKALEDAAALIVSWANRGSHTDDVAKT